VRKILSAIIITSFFLGGCSSTTIISSTDKESKIYADGQMVGVGQGVYRDTKVVGSTTAIRISKDGCHDQNYILTRNEEADIGAIIGGVIFIVPFLWVTKYKPEHNYYFKCSQE
jgi:hypothetical protein